jgi:CheY-like chemotaxis protein
MRLKSGFNNRRVSAHAKSVAQATLGERELDRPRLLLIDDEPVLADFVATVAADCGFDPILTSDDRQFRESFVDACPAMVVMDLGMPGMDGVELLRFLADAKCNCPVLIISGFDRRVLESAFRLGEALGLRMVGPLEKPVFADNLEEVFNELRPTLAS